MNLYQKLLDLPESETPSDHYGLLGIPRFTENTQQIHAALVTRNTQLRAWDNSKLFREANALLDEVVAAGMILEDPVRKAIYDAELRQRLGLPAASLLPVTAPAPVVEAPSWADSFEERDEEPLLEVPAVRREKSATDRRDHGTGSSHREAEHTWTSFKGLSLKLGGGLIALVLLIAVSVAMRVGREPDPVTGSILTPAPANNLASPGATPSENVSDSSDAETRSEQGATNLHELLTINGHIGTFWSVAFSPDGTRLASACGNGSNPTVQVWHATSGQEMLTLNGHTSSVWSVAFSPDGKRLASASYDRTVKVWDATSGAVLLTLTGHTDGIRSVAFSPDGKRLASASDDRTVTVWDTTSGQTMLTLKGHAWAVTSVAFSPDGTRLASASGDNTVKVWDAASGQAMSTLNGHTKTVLSVAYNPDGKHLASGSSDGTVKVWDVTSGQEMLTLKGQTGEVMSVAYSPDGTWLASAGGYGDNIVKVWDATSGQEMLTLTGHTSGIKSVAFSPDGTRLASTSDDGTVRVWDVVQSKAELSKFPADLKMTESPPPVPAPDPAPDSTNFHALATLAGHTRAVRGVAFSPDGQMLASASDDRTVKVWDTTSGRETLTLRGNFWCVAFNPDGKRLASGGTNGAKVWDISSGLELLTLKGQTNAVTCVAFSPDGKRLASGGIEGVKVWDISNGREILTLTGHTKVVSSLAFSQDGKRLASASEDQTVKIWDATSGQEKLTFKEHAWGVRSVAFSPDGTRLASASNDNTVKVWDATSGQETLTFRILRGLYSNVTFSADGTRLAAAAGPVSKQAEPSAVTLWDATNGQKMLILGVHSDTIFCVALSPDGTRLASAGKDRTVKIWKADQPNSESLNSLPEPKLTESPMPVPDPAIERAWDPANVRELATLTGHADDVRSVTFSPEGKRLASASDDGTVKVWDVISGKEMLNFTGQASGVRSVAYSPDGKRLASAGDDRTVKVWEAASGRERLTLSGHIGNVASVAFRPDGKRLASASWDRTVKVWNALNGQVTLTLTGHAGDVNSVTFSPDGKRLASASDDKTVRIWNALSGRVTLTLTGHTSAVNSVAFSPDGKFLATASGDRTAKVWDAMTGKEMLTFDGHTMDVNCVAFSPDGKYIASGCYHNTVRVWEAISGQETLKLSSRSPSLSVAFSSDGQRLASGSYGDTVTVWELNQDAVSGSQALANVARPVTTNPATPGDNSPGSAPAFAIAPFDADQARQHQTDWAKHLGSPATFDNSIQMKLSLIPPGTFTMGDDAGSGNEKPAHQVTLTQPFYMQTTEVTQSQWKSVMGTEPWKNQIRVKEGVDVAATYVSHDDAVAFCRRLSQLEGLNYRLPTEAEWEYTCRSGTTTTYSFDSSAGQLRDYGWFADNASAVGEGYAHPVGQKRRNALGLYDMHGNVWEWCSDWYDAEYYTLSPILNPMGPESGARRVERGGAWFLRTDACRSSFRYYSEPEFHNYLNGFRVARTF